MKSNIATIAIAALALTILAGCSDKKNQEFKAQVDTDFIQRSQKDMPQGGFFDIFDTSMTEEELSAMKFLYAYMIIGDITDYSGEFYLDNVRSSLSTRRETTWGKNIPDMIFNHFVLPVRVNNESLDSARMVFHDILMPRISGMSMREAVLEVNHWCHEKVNYQPSDARTSAPLATVRTAYGRCGEESTLLVAALRSVGIPARQVYTPRWAHTDDNHAWVEAWVDGKWCFLGACEPEPVLNLGWFNAPASRGMLMHTKVFGRYNGPEEVMKTTANYTEINVIGNYAENALAKVRVVDEQNNVVEGASVEFKLYNYAEFYTVSKQLSDSSGVVSLSAGLGDMLAIAIKDGRFGVEKVSFGNTEIVDVPLKYKVGEEFAIDFDIVPPVEKANIPVVTDEQRAENDRRFNYEDSLRNSYVATFPTESEITDFLNPLGLDYESAGKYICDARGNYAVIKEFLAEAHSKSLLLRAVELLGTLSAKDLRDVPLEVLQDHLYNTNPQSDVATVLAPRVENEMLTPYRSYFKQNVPVELAEKFKSNPSTLVEWCKENITLRNDLATVNTIMSPVGVWRGRVTDSRSVRVFFVALARSLDIPAWIDWVTGNTFYRHNSVAILANLEPETDKIYETGSIALDYKPRKRLDDPEYYRHYTLSRLGDDDSFELLNYPDFEKWSKVFKSPSKVETGYYMLTTGSRLASGTVLSRITFFNVAKDDSRKVDFVVRDDSDAVGVIGAFNSESRFTAAKTGKETSVLLTSGRGYFVVGILGVGQEPTNHALRDIAQQAEELEKWGRSIILLFPDRDSYEKYMAHPIEGLPETVSFGIDSGNIIASHIRSEMKLPGTAPLPLFVIADTFNRVVFESHGYTIGLGNQLIKTIQGL